MYRLNTCSKCNYIYRILLLLFCGFTRKTCEFITPTLENITIKILEPGATPTNDEILIVSECLIIEVLMKFN